jgi:hypothetical protein
MRSRSFTRNALAIKALNLCNELRIILMRAAGSLAARITACAAQLQEDKKLFG